MPEQRVSNSMISYFSQPHLPQPSGTEFVSEVNSKPNERLNFPFRNVRNGRPGHKTMGRWTSIIALRVIGRRLRSEVEQSGANV